MLTSRQWLPLKYIETLDESTNEQESHGPSAEVEDHLERDIPNG